MGYKEVSKALVATDLAAQQYEFSRRRRILVVPEEFIRSELGLGRLELTPTTAEELESELRLFQHLQPNDIVKALHYDYTTESLRFYIINKDLPEVELDTLPPETIIKVQF